MRCLVSHWLNWRQSRSKSRMDFSLAEASFRETQNASHPLFLFLALTFNADSLAFQLVLVCKAQILSNQSQGGTWSYASWDELLVASGQPFVNVPNCISQDAVVDSVCNCAESADDTAAGLERNLKTTSNDKWDGLKISETKWRARCWIKEGGKHCLNPCFSSCQGPNAHDQHVKCSSDIAVVWGLMLFWWCVKVSIYCSALCKSLFWISFGISLWLGLEPSTRCGKYNPFRD